MNEIKINDLKLSKRSRNALINNNVNNLGSLLDLNHEIIDDFRNIGTKSKLEILDFIELVNNKKRNNNFELSGFLNDDFVELLNAYDITNGMELMNTDIEDVIYRKLENGSIDTIEYSSLSNRSKNQLIKNGYIYISQLKGLTDETLENIKNLGAKSIQEIKDFRDNFNPSYEVVINTPIDVPIESLRYVEISEVIDDDDIVDILKINNVQVLGVLLDLSYEDIQKFRNVDNDLIIEIQSICKRLRENVNLIDKDLFDLVCQYPYKSIEEVIQENVPKTLSKISMKFLFKNRYVNVINIDEHGFSGKEKKILLTYNLNDIDTLLSVSYHGMLNNPSISKKTLNVILEKLLNQVVVFNKNEIFLGDISRLYLKESPYNYLLVMREKYLSNILVNLKNIIREFLKEERFSINHEIDLLIENHLISSYISNLEVNDVLSQEVMYAYVENSPSAFSEDDIYEAFSKQFIKLDVHKVFDELIKLDLIAIDEDDKVYSKKPSILSYVAENFNENTLEIMKLRLEGQTLEEIGDIVGITRERVRQVVKKVVENTTQTFKEDENKYWFSNYELDNKEYRWLFNDDLYNFLSNRYEKGTKSWKDIINDDKASVQLKMKIRNKLLKGKIEIGNKIIPKTRTSIIDYVLEEYGQEVLYIDDLSELINMFLEELGLDKEEFEINIRYLENRLSDTSNAVSRGKRYQRFYEYDAYDWDLFYEELNFEEWKNLEISAEILFKYHPSLMEQYDIKHENELHNIIRRTRDKISDLNIELNRMPNISIGNVDREQQVKDLMYEYAPIYVEEFVELYYETYGVKVQTVKANYLKYIDKYIADDYIKGNFDSVNQEDLNYVERIINDRDFMFIEDLKNELKQDIADLHIILKHLNYKTFTSYILKSEYETSVNYYNEKFYHNMNIVDLAKIDKRIWNLSSFGAWLYDKYKKMELLEFSPKKYITRNKLNEIGLTLDILEDFRNEVLDRLNDNQVWSINTIIDVIDNEKIDSFGFEPIFYRSILRGLENIYSNKIGGNYLLKKDVDFTVSELIEEEVTKVKMIDIFDLTEIINEKYDINLEYYKLTEAVKKTSMYYDEIMEKVYLDLNYYYEEFDY